MSFLIPLAAHWQQAYFGYLIIKEDVYMKYDILVSTLKGSVLCVVD